MGAIEVPCDACGDRRSGLVLIPMEVVVDRLRPNAGKHVFRYCGDRPGCREKAQAWWKSDKKAPTPAGATFGEWRGDAPGDLYQYSPLTPEIVTEWFRWVRETDQEHDLFTVVAEALQALLYSGGPVLGDGAHPADVHSANAISSAVALGICTVPEPPPET